MADAHSVDSVRRVTIVIPNWNGLKHLPDCLQALAGQTFRGFRTVVVDNASTDGSIGYIEKEWPGVDVIRLPDNLGFPAAVNAGIGAADTEYVVLLNNDTKADPDWLEKLVRGMDSHPEFASGSSKLLRFYTPDKIDSAGHTYSLWLGAADNVGEEQDARGYDDPAWIFGTCAAASIYRRELFEDIGGFDDDFFFTHEDVDFDLRANVAGHRCLLIPEAIVYHKRGASYELTPELTLMGVRNRIWTAGKNLPPLALALWIVGKFLRVVWWVPARLLGHTPGRRTGGQKRRGSAVAWRDVRIRDAIGAALAATRTLPAKRRAARPTRRLSSIEVLRVLHATRTPRPL
jgi:GT2 family glycosyltransferase